MSFIEGFEKTAGWKHLGIAAAIGLAAHGAHARQPTAEQLKLIDEKATAAGIDPKVMEGLVATESSFVPTRVNKEHTANKLRHSIGLAQVQPRTAKQFGFKGKPADLLKPETSLEYGTKYLAHQLQRYHGDYPKALSAYNAGHFTTANKSYVTKILKYKR